MRSPRSASNLLENFKSAVSNNEFQKVKKLLEKSASDT